jgi:PadR family transcriptional regulator, regulatory protein PadR
MAGPRITVQTQAVLAVFLGRLDRGQDGAGGGSGGGNGELWGFELSRESGLPAGTIYPILQRLTAAGWVSDWWEDPAVARAEKRPARRYYRLTVDGRARAVHALGQVGPRRASLVRLLGAEAEGGAL